MSLPYLSNYTLRAEDKARLETDPEYAFAAFERLLGEPRKREATGKGFVSFRCPTPACDKNDYKFGVVLAQNTRETLGCFNCFRCGLHGRGFVSLCRLLGNDPGLYVVAGFGGAAVTREPGTVITAPSQNVLNNEHYVQFWRWIAQQSRIAYGSRNNGLSAIHIELLIRKGVKLDSIPPWFSMPPTEVMLTAISRWGQLTCERAGIVYPGTRDRTTFFNPGRIALVYPAAPFGTNNVPFSYLRSYNPAPATPRDKKQKLLSATGYSSSYSMYIRAPLVAEPAPWLVTEGEIKAEISSQALVYSIGLPGMNVGRETLAAMILAAWERTNGTYPNGIVGCFDTEPDEEGQRRVELAFYNLLERVNHELHTHTGRTIPFYRLRLPNEPKKKQDVDAYVAGIAVRSNIETAHKVWRNSIRGAIQAGPVTERPPELRPTIRGREGSAQA